jgi:hypothetical protein
VITYQFTIRERRFMAAFIAECPRVPEIAVGMEDFTEADIPAVRTKLLAELPAVELDEPERKFLETLVGGTGDQWWGNLPERCGLAVNDDLGSLFRLISDGSR